MDAFAVSICKGLSVQKLRPHHGLIAGAYFGGFQALMPLIGWLLGRQFESLIKNIDHWVAFVLLALIGANMVRESFGGDDEVNASFSFKTMLPLAVATSIDALAVGVTFAFLDVNIWFAIALIGVFKKASDGWKAMWLKSAGKYGLPAGKATGAMFATNGIELVIRPVVLGAIVSHGSVASLVLGILCAACAGLFWLVTRHTVLKET